MPDSLAQREEVLRRFASGVRAAQLYAADHPLIARSIDGLMAALEPLHQQCASVTIGIVGTELVVGGTPLPRTSAGMGDLIKRLKDHHVERISFDRGVTNAEALEFILAVGRLAGRAGQLTPAWEYPHIHVGRIATDDRQGEGVASDIQSLQQVYKNSVAAAELAWNTALAEGRPDMKAARDAVEWLSDSVTRNRTAIVALTAIRTHDAYTFTHMVNVSILTMGQARGLGIEGRLLREFGLSALMHDIGKVRTPREILNKAEKLTEPEFAIMRRHTIDGAELLRRTP